MGVQVATLDILVKEAHFEPAVARAVGAAIETEIRGAQLVTTPVLDLRLSDLKGSLELKIAQLESRLFLKMVGIGLTGLGILLAVLRLFSSSFMPS